MYARAAQPRKRPYPGNSEIVDPSLDPNTYLVSVKDDVKEKDYVTSNLYVQILN